MSNLPLIISTDYLREAEPEFSIFDGEARFECLLATTPEQVVGRVRDAKVLIVFHEVVINGEVLANAQNCVGIVRGGVGFDNLDLNDAGERGIVVCNVPDYGTEEVADHAMALMLCMTRRILDASSAVRRGEWDCRITEMSPRHRQQRIGILGCGRIGSAMALRAKSFGMSVVMFDPYQARGVEKALGVDRAWSLDEFLPQCDMLSIHCYRSTETIGILNRKTLGLLPDHAYIVNTARGGLIDEAALIEHLEMGRFSGVGLDVVTSEPLEGNALRHHPRVIVTPHAAFNSAVAGPELRLKTAEEAMRMVRGIPVRNPVNLNQLKNPRTPV